MASILSIAYSGLNAFQNGMNVTANNLTNRFVPGYTKKAISFAAGPTFQLGSAYVGTGVTTGSVSRFGDQFAIAQLRTMQTIKSQYDTFYQQASQIDKLLSDDNNSVSGSLQTFFQALGQVNNSPDGVNARNVLFKQSQLLVGQFNSLQKRLDENLANTQSQLFAAVNEINALTGNIAALNGQLISTPNDPNLLDLRDELIRQLSAFTEVMVTNQNNGSVTVSLASGDNLVLGENFRTLSVNTNSSIQGSSIMLGTGSNVTDVTSRISTGSLGGLLNYETSVLGQASQLIGQMAIGLAQKFNAQHHLGMDMNSNLGGDFFTDFNSPTLQLARAISNKNNQGTATLSVNISDIGQTQLSDYTFSVTNTITNQVQVTRQSDGQVFTMNLSQNPPSPPAGQLVLDGMTINVDNVANLKDGDQFNLSPTRGAATNLALQVTNINQIALASPVRTQAALSNTGQGQISLGTVLNTSAVNTQYSINFTDPTHFMVVDVVGGTSTGPFPFNPNSNNSIPIPDSTNPSYYVTLSGAPNAGDQFVAEYNSGGIGDNGNGLLLGAIQQNKFFSGGTASLLDTYSSLLTQIGSQTGQAKIQSDAATVLYKQAVANWESSNGVNVDEEGANLMRFEAAYKAASKLLQVTSEMMNVLFEAMR